MNNPIYLFTVFTKPRQRFFESFRVFHAFPVLNQVPGTRHRTGNTKDNPLFFTNLPKKKRKRFPKVKEVKPHTGTLIIDCKRKIFNHYSGMIYGKFEKVPLASEGWHHKKSKGDYFTILPTLNHPAFVTKEELPSTFEENGVSPQIIEQLKKIDVAYPTVIQVKACQHLLKGHNLFMSGECGSGKTVAYSIALIQNVLKLKEQVSETLNSPFGIVLVPSRELAIQIGGLIDKLGSDLGIRCQTLIGGSIKDLILNPEIVPVDILVCTLRVLLKHLHAKLYNTLFCKHVVVDEADVFLERSFQAEFRSFLIQSKLIFTGLTTDRLTGQNAQICFVSATVPKLMEEKLFTLIQGNPMEVETTSFIHKTFSSAKQVFRRVLKNEKPEELLKTVKANVKNKIPTMIFSNKKSTAVWVGEFLQENSIECANITTTEFADDRLTNFRNFEEGLTKVISCTDLASRGLSFTNVKHVINYEFPTFMSDYIHRCGRTGRLDQGDNCIVTNFISSKHELYLLKEIELAVRLNSPLPHVFLNRVKKYEQTLKLKAQHKRT